MDLAGEDDGHSAVCGDGAQLAAQGIDVAAGIEREPSARLAVLTPSYQFPLGVTLRDTGSGAGDNHQVVAGDPAPHLHPLVPVRGRIPHVAPADGLVEPDEALLAECEQMRILGQHVQPAEFGGQPLGRGHPDRAVRAGGASGR
ncbi:hypothetical protein CBI38_14960 [Rhodococcus oxybenzonivorans]|uniref:Uncharacterized protein n=1 Tax=Rhodococcus oxybenzonivorans TaxID=1990687 RepID=A0A2S2BVQ4_9NOCA|nr:hypothetical protein [Rhodococcus oxybenzonivorans]AWK72673.1 hypothetical protein CBI38_14960 [Rhodococcus oxybenzonivorans]